MNKDTSVRNRNDEASASAKGTKSLRAAEVESQNMTQYACSEVYWLKKVDIHVF